MGFSLLAFFGDFEDLFSREDEFESAEDILKEVKAILKHGKSYAEECGQL